MQQPYYPGGPAGGVPQQQQAAAPRPPPVKRSHAIQIIDPNTGKEVDLKGAAAAKKEKDHKDEAAGDAKVGLVIAPDMPRFSSLSRAAAACAQMMSLPPRQFQSCSSVLVHESPCHGV